MANIASQEKRIHRSERERNENRRYTSSVKTSLRKLEAAKPGLHLGGAAPVLEALALRPMNPLFL